MAFAVEGASIAKPVGNHSVPVAAGLPAMPALRLAGITTPISSRASPLPHCPTPAADFMNTTKPVGAGLPAIPALRLAGITTSMPSRASPLPHYPTLPHASRRLYEHHKTCGSWLACAAGTAVGRDNYVDAIAGKPAPTLPHASRRLYEHHKICGSWLACDTGTAVGRDNYVDAIAGKPAPTRVC